MWLTLCQDPILNFQLWNLIARCTCLGTCWYFILDSKRLYRQNKQCEPQNKFSFVSRHVWNTFSLVFRFLEIEVSACRCGRGGNQVIHFWLSQEMKEDWYIENRNDGRSTTWKQMTKTATHIKKMTVLNMVKEHKSIWQGPFWLSLEVSLKS